MIKRRGAPRLANHLSDCSVSSRVVVMVQWLAHLTCNPGNAGSIPTHGICVFHSKWISQYFVLARDYIVGFPVLHSKYIYIYIWKKKTNKLQVHPYKPVSWSPTHHPLMKCRDYCRVKELHHIYKYGIILARASC